MHPFQAMSNLVILFFFCNKISPKSLKISLSKNKNSLKRALFNKERDANAASQFLY